MELIKFQDLEGITGRVNSSGEPFFSRSPALDPSFTAIVDNLTPVFHINNLAIVSIRTGETQLGILQAVNISIPEDNPDLALV